MKDKNLIYVRDLLATVRVTIENNRVNLLTINLKVLQEYMTDCIYMINSTKEEYSRMNRSVRRI